MKTVWKAVNWLKGDLDNSVLFMGEESGFLVENRDGRFAAIESMRFVGRRLIICSIGEFNELVAEMETNFGKSSLKHLDIWQQEIKRQNKASKATKLEVESKVDYTSEEFWKDAPEWATDYATPKGMLNKTKYWIGKNNYQSLNVNGVKNTYGKEYIWTRDSFDILASRPQPKPVYTQEMRDKGELPGVGMFIMVDDCNGCGMYIDVEVMYCSDSICVVNDGNNDHSFCPHSFRISPIDARTDKEKAIDDMVKMLGRSIAYKDVAEHFYDKWSKGNE